MQKSDVIFVVEDSNLQMVHSRERKKESTGEGKTPDSNLRTLEFGVKKVRLGDE